MYVNSCNFRRRKEAEKILKHKDLTIEIQLKTGVTINNKGDWNRLKVTQKTPEQHTGKARN